MSAWITAISIARVGDTIGHAAARSLGIEPRSLRFEDRIALTRAIDVWERAIALTDRELPARAACYAAHDERSVVAYVAANQPTLGAGLAKLVQYYPTASNAYRWDLETSEREVVLVCAPVVPIERVGWQAQLELELIDIACTARQLTGCSATALRFQHAPPADTLARICAQTGIVVELGWPRYEVVWPAMLAASPLANARPYFAEELERRLAVLLAAELERRSMTERVRRVLARGSPVGRWTVPEIARKLAVSRRSLERALATEGTSVQRILDDEQLAVALACLDHVSVDEVALRLGYSDTRAFARAFKRWTGKSPSAVRATLRDQPSVSGRIVPISSGVRTEMSPKPRFVRSAR
jgi:AraC-like DNA-binding protein